MIINAGADVEGAESSGVIAVLSDQMKKFAGPRSGPHYRTSTSSPGLDQ